MMILILKYDGKAGFFDKVSGSSICMVKSCSRVLKTLELKAILNIFVLVRVPRGNSSFTSMLELNEGVAINHDIFIFEVKFAPFITILLLHVLPHVFELL